MSDLEQLGKRWAGLFDKKDLRGLMTMYAENCLSRTCRSRSILLTQLGAMPRPTH
jgi:hypothetical protein